MRSLYGSCFSFRILVLDKGHVIEHDTPAALLAKQDGSFRGMAKDAGLMWYSACH